jgi:hypothetical protein
MIIISHCEVAILVLVALIYQLTESKELAFNLCGGKVRFICIYMYACIYSMYAYIFILNENVCVYIFECLTMRMYKNNSQTCIHIHTCMFAFVYVCIYIYINVCVFMHVYKCAIYVYTYMCIYDICVYRFKHMYVCMYI